jgi:RHS repeat-associated protein
MKKIMTIGFAALGILTCNSWAQQCGNDCPGGPAKCNDCKTKSGGGANPVAAYSGSVNREITDVEIFGGIGEEKLAFRRLTTSRYKPGIPTPLGTGGSWRHNYYWNIIPAGTDQTSGNEIIHIDYPDATEHDFHKETSTSIYLTAVSSTQERVEQLSTDPNQYYLWFPDGRRLAFYKVGSGASATFQQQGLYDRYNNFYAFAWDPIGKCVTSITEPSGRYIQIQYGYIGNFNAVTTTFLYDNPTATTVTVLGDFNAWGNPSGNPMARGPDGLWRATVPVQPQTAYQYKFLVNGSVWISDPRNPNTIPAGGPSTGNNSVVTVTNSDLGTTSSTVPVTFSYTNASANTVSVAGGFNGWNSSQNQLSKSGDTWTVTIYIPQGIYDYKFVVNGGTWVQDPANPYKDPDGYGGYNSRLAVGPYDQAITSINTSDGRSVVYNYSMYGVGGTLYSTLIKASYSDGTQAIYSYDAPSTGSRPTLATANDPRYKGPATRVSYTYQNNGIEGFVSEEKSLVDGTVLTHLDPSSTLHRQLITGPRAINLDFYSGNVNQQLDSLARKTTYTYFDNGWGMLASSTEWDGATQYTTSYELSAQFGNQTKITLPDGKTQLTHYSSDTKPFYADSTTDENGNITTYTLDSNGRRTRIDYPTPTGSAAIYETFTYGGTSTSAFTDANGKSVTLLSSHRLKSGSIETFTYYVLGESGGKRGDLKTKTDAAGHMTTYVYNATGLKISEADDSTPAKTTSYEYNERGQLTKITFPDTKTQLFAYADGYGNRTRATNELGKQWNYLYDQYNRLTDLTDPLNHTTHYAYDLPPSGGCTTCSVENYPTSITLPSGKKTTIEYDTEWQKKKVAVGANTVDAALTQYDYDGVGNLKSVTDPRGNVWNYTYDSRKRRTRESAPVSIGTYTDFGYDGVGNKTSEKRSGDAVATVYTYDVAYRLTQVTDAKGQITKTTYDTGGNMLTLQDPRTDQNNTNIYTFSYDGLNHKLSLTYPDGTTETWTYTNAGNIATYKTRANQTETIGYDARDRETSTSWTDATPGTSKTYFDNGLLKTLSSSVSSLTYAYDDANRLTSEIEQINSDSGAKTVSYGYDSDNNRTSIGYPSGSTVTLGYTNRNQVNNISTTGISAGYTYDLNGNSLTKSLGNTTSASYTWDAANRLTSLDHQKSGTSFVKEDYVYNSVNTRASRAETISGLTKTDAYSYDAIDEVTQVRYNVNGANQDRLVGYNYDAAGNRKDSNGVSGVTDSVNGNTSYSANNQNQYTVIGSLSPTHDSNGNLHSQDGWTYTYDSLNRLTSAATGSTTMTFTYDGRNRCVSRTLNGTVTFFYWDDWNLIEERDASDSLQARYIHGPKLDDLVARIVGNSTYCYHQDALGSTVALTDSSGNAAERYTYDIFGTPTFKDGSGNIVSGSASGNRFLLTGREYVQQIGVYDYRNRAYSPQFGRFFQSDPVSFKADVNLYRYVVNSPANKRDPTGLVPVPCNSDEIAACKSECEGKGDEYVSCQADAGYLFGVAVWRNNACLCKKTMELCRCSCPSGTQIDRKVPKGEPCPPNVQHVVTDWQSDPSGKPVPCRRTETCPCAKIGPA